MRERLRLKCQLVVAAEPHVEGLADMLTAKFPSEDRQHHKVDNRFLLFEVLLESIGSELQ